MVKYCDKCGNELKNEDAKFCDKCGSEIKVIEQNEAKPQQNNTKPVVAGVVCRKCGEIVPITEKVCPNCNTPTEDNKTAVIVGYIVTWIFSIFGFIPAVYLISRDNKKSNTQGFILLAMSILSLLYLANSIVAFIIEVILTIIGIYLWVSDKNLIN